MAHPNEDLVRDIFAAFGRGDVDALRSQYLAADACFHYPGRGPLAGDYEGVAQVLEMAGRTAGLSGGTYRLELHDAVAVTSMLSRCSWPAASGPAGGSTTALWWSSTSAMARRPRCGFTQPTSTPTTNSGPDIARPKGRACGALGRRRRGQLSPSSG